jgi:inner membrane protein
VRRAAALGCLAAVLAADWVILRRKPRWIVSGLFDEPAHVATAGLVLLRVPRRSGPWTRGFLVGAALPDLDHVPLALSRVHPDIDDPRPVTHCLLAIAPLALAGVVTRGAPSEYATGAVAGALVHFARDLAVGTGVALFRPLDGRSLKVPYPLYAAALVALAAGAARQRPASRAERADRRDAPERLRADPPRVQTETPR